MRHVDVARVAPLGDDIAVADDDAVGGRMRLERTDGIGERSGELQRDGDAHVALIDHAVQLGRKLRLIGDGEVDRGLELGGIETFRLRRVVLPGTFWRNIIGGIYRRRECQRCDETDKR